MKEPNILILLYRTETLKENNKRSRRLVRLTNIYEYEVYMKNLCIKICFEQKCHHYNDILEEVIERS